MGWETAPLHWDQKIYWQHLNLVMFSGKNKKHYCDIIMDTMASQITSLMIVYSTIHSDADQRKHHCPASLAFVWGIHRWQMNSPHKWPVTQKMIPFDVYSHILIFLKTEIVHHGRQYPCYISWIHVLWLMRTWLGMDLGYQHGIDLVLPWYSGFNTRGSQQLNIIFTNQVASL